MKRKSFLKSLLTIPFIGSALLEAKSKPVSLDSAKQGGISILNTKPTEPKEGILVYAKNDGLYIFRNGKYQLLATKTWIQS